MVVVSGSSIDFMRPMTEAVSGVLTEQLIGSNNETKYETKPVSINEFIGGWKRQGIPTENSELGKNEL